MLLFCSGERCLTLPKVEHGDFEAACCVLSNICSQMRVHAHCLRVYSVSSCIAVRVSARREIEPSILHSVEAREVQLLRVDELASSELFHTCW